MSERDLHLPEGAREVVVLDEQSPCPYLPGRTARLPYRFPIEPLTPAQLDRQLKEGDRRYGVFLYRTQCSECAACEPIRLDVETFKPDATQKRMERRGDRLLTVRVGAPVVNHERIELFNRHRDKRGLAQGQPPIDANAYAQFLAESCCQTIEISYWHEERLVAVAIADVGREAISAVYCYYDPEFRPLSLGTYSILRQVQLCRALGRRYLYLGFYVAESPHMNYKARFRPHERRISGEWLRS